MLLEISMSLEQGPYSFCLIGFSVEQLHDEILFPLEVI